MKRSTDRILVTHVGSLVRPDDLAQLLAAKELGRSVDEAAFEVTLRASVGEVVRKQAEVGVDIPSDGEYGKATIDELAELGLDMTAPRRAAKSAPGALSGKTLVVTGTLAKYGRDEIEELIALHGGRAVSSVSKNTDYLVAGEKAGSKLAKAQALGVRVLSEAEFDALIGG